MSSSIANAQSPTVPPTNLVIKDVDSSQFPTISVSVLSTDLPMDMLRLPIQIAELTDPNEQQEDAQGGPDFRAYPEYIGAERLIIIDIDAFDEIGVNGRSHRANFESIIRDIYDHPTVFANGDWLSAYVMARSVGVTQLTEWSQDKGGYFIDLVTYDFDAAETATLPGASRTTASELTNRESPSLDLGLPQLSANALIMSDPESTKLEGNSTAPTVGTLRSVFQRFETLPQDSQAVRSVIIFSDSNQSPLSAGRLSLRSLIQYAQQNQIYVHGVHLGRDGDQEGALVNSELMKIVEETGGLYVYHQVKSDLIPLWTRLNEEKQRTRLIYQSSGEMVQAIQVQVRLPDGSYAKSLKHPVHFPAADAGLVDSVPTVMESAATDSSAFPNRENGSGASVLWSAIPQEVVAFATPLLDRMGLVDGMAGMPRSTLLILWALCLGLLFFLVYPESSRGWRLLRSQQKRAGGKMRPNAAAVDAASAVSVNGLQPQMATLAQGKLNRTTAHLENGYIENGLENGNMYPGYQIDDDPALAHIESDATDIYLPVRKQEIGKLIRITYDATLPQEVEIHQTSPSDVDEIFMYIGRDSQTNTVVIPDRKKRVSREHAILVLEKGLLYLRDNASVAGTYLNGVKFEDTERKLLRDGDRIGLGVIEYQIQLQSEEATVVTMKENALQPS